MAKYHINEKGVPAPCKARFRACPLGGEHFDNRDRALEYAQKLNEKSFGILPGTNKRKPDINEGTFISKKMLTYGSEGAMRTGQLVLFKDGTDYDTEEQRNKQRQERDEITDLLVNGRHKLTREEKKEFEEDVKKYAEVFGNKLKKVFGGFDRFVDKVTGQIANPVVYRSAKKSLVKKAGGNPEMYNNFLKTWGREGQNIASDFNPDINENEMVVTSSIFNRNNAVGLVGEDGEFVLPPVFTTISNGKYMKENVEDKNFQKIAGNLEEGYYFAWSRTKDLNNSACFAISKNTGKVAKITTDDGGKSWGIDGEKLNENTFYDNIENSNYSIIDFSHLTPEFERKD